MAQREAGRRVRAAENGRAVDGEGVQEHQDVQGLPQRGQAHLQGDREGDCGSGQEEVPSFQGWYLLLWGVLVNRWNSEFLNSTPFDILHINICTK